MLTAKRTAVLGKPPAPSTPTGLVATGGALQVVLTWTAQPGVTFELWRGSAPGNESLVTFGLTGTGTTDTGLSSGTLYYYVIYSVQNGVRSVLPSNEVSAYTNSSLLTGLQAYYNFTTLTTDNSGHGNTLTNNNGVTQGAGIIGQAANLVVSSAQFLSLADNAFVDFTSQLSISHWFKFTATGDAANQAMISKGNHLSNLEWLINIPAGSGHVGFFLGSTSAAIFGSANGTTLTNGNWYHVAVVYDGSLTGNSSRVKMWINGVSQTLTFAGTFPSANTPAAGSFFIGKLGGATPEYCDGLIDEIALANVAWTSTQIAALYGSGSPPAYPFQGVS